jgi:glyoxylase I family protein
LTATGFSNSSPRSWSTKVPSSTDELFRILADPTRRRVVDLLAERGTMSVGEITNEFPELNPSGISKHLMYLRAAGLVKASRQGRQQLYNIEPAAIADAIAPWLTKYEPYWSGALERLRDLAETQGTTRPQALKPAEAPVSATAPAFDVVLTAPPQVILFSADVERACEFYRRLGFQETFRVPEHGTRIHADLVLAGYKIGFASIASSREHHGLHPADHGHRATITLWTQDTATTYRSLTAAGVPGLAEPHVWLDRLLIAWVQDPDGHPTNSSKSSAPAERT